jgi:hypothetical protein
VPADDDRAHGVIAVSASEEQFRDYYNDHRVHASLEGSTPICKTAGATRGVIDLDDYQWQSHCRGLYQLPAAA